MKKINLNDRFCLVLVALGLFVLCSFFWWPQITHVLSLKSQLNKNQQLLASLTQKRATLEALDENALKNKNDFLFRLLPTTADPMVLISGLRLLAERAGVTLAEIDIALAKKEELSLKVTLLGEIDRLLEFASLAPEVYPFIRLNFSEIKGSEEGPYRAVIEATTFFRPAPDRVDSVETPVEAPLPSENELFVRLSGLKPLFSTTDDQNDFVEVPSGKSNPFAP